MGEGRLGQRLQKLPEQLTNVILLGFFWTVTSLGIVTVGAATTALNESMRAFLLEGDQKPLKVFFRAFREQFKLSTLVWLIHLGVLAVLAVDLLYYSVGKTAGDSFAMAVMCTLLTMLCFELSVVFACMVQFRPAGLRAAFSRAFDFAFRCFRESLEMLFITAAVVAVGLFLFRGILPFGAGIVAWANWRILPGAFRRYQTRTAATRKAEERMEQKKP